MQTREVVTSPGRAGFDPTHPMPSAPHRSRRDEGADTTALLRRVHARVRMELASRRHGARVPQTKRVDGTGR